MALEFSVMRHSTHALSPPNLPNPAPHAPRPLPPRAAAGMALEFSVMRHSGCRLLVAGRADKTTGRFMTLSDVAVPACLDGLMAPIPEAEFRADVSSTQLRAAGRGVPAAAAAAATVVAAAAEGPGAAGR
jgi:hypothetical protein